MSAKDKEGKSLHDKFKQFFRRGKTGGLANYKTINEFAITEDLAKDLSKDSPINIRIKTIKELCETVELNRLEDKGIEKLWMWVQDLLARDQPKEYRYLVFEFLRCLINGQRERLGAMRAHFFRVIKNHDHPEDVGPRFELLFALTENGKNVTYFEDEIGQFLLNWLPDISMAGKTQEYLNLLDNLIKFHAVYIEDEVVSGLVENICVLACKIDKPLIVLASLQVLQDLVAHKALPSESLPQFIVALCRTVNAEAYCQNSWKVMRHLLGTHKGHSALYTMCRILEDPRIQQDCVLIRGAVFYINMALWGKQAVTSLQCPPSSVLPSLLAALECRNAIVTYEVILSIQRLVNKYGAELLDSGWDTILKILELINNLLQTSENIQNQKSIPESNPNSLVASYLHETLNTMEKLIEMGCYNGSVKAVYDLIELCAVNRPEVSVLGLVTYLSKAIIPTKHLWLQNLYSLLHKYFRQETRTNIRLKVLEVLSSVINMNRMRYEDELIDGIVIPHMSNIASDPDVIVRTAVVEILVDLCRECESKKCLELLDILEKLLMQPYELEYQSISETDISDVIAVVVGLIRVFCVKIHRLPSNHSVRIFKMVVSFLETHYKKPTVFENCNIVRYKIFECFLKMRADSNYHLGCADIGGVMRFSPYLCVANVSGERLSPPPSSPAIMQQPTCQITYLSLDEAFKTIIICLKHERDWEVLHLLLQEIPNVLQNKALILSKQGNKDIDLLCGSLCSMITDKTLALPDGLRNNAKLNRSDFQAAVLIVIAGLSSYHAYLEPGYQKTMIRCLMKNGLVSPKCSKQCITALTTCTLEMRDVMIKMLPEVLLELSKISATVHIAFSVLEFLSTLTRLPLVFASFVADQYMSVFAIALPYTNPFKYNHYTVSLAHHVIAVWFLKCRLPFRRDFVKFIAQGLLTNFKQINMSRNDLVTLNEDSSTRKRSSSLTEQGSRRRERTVLQPRSEGKPSLDLRRPMIDKTLLTFYEELTETCIDLMARYTFSPCSALPKRLSTSEFLLSGGQSMTWLLGNKLITVTTSGCSQNPLKHGLCDKCWQTCKTEPIKSPEIDEYKRPKSLLVRTGSGENKDDNLSNRVTRQNSGEQKSTSNTSASSPIEETKRITDKLEQLPNKLHQLASKENSEKEKQLCACWCQGWAEIYVRRPTGDMSWIMRIQNQVSYQNSIYDFPLNEVATLFMPTLSRDVEDFDTETQLLSEETEFSAVSVPISIPGSPTKRSPSRQSSRDSIDEDYDTIYEDGNRSRNPVKRSNSSPEMSANWKNPFLSQDKNEKYLNSDEDFDAGQKKKKDMRVSCEAIPEEISGLGTTPPSNERLENTDNQQQQHPSLGSYHSYPGTQPDMHSTTSTKASSSTVPQSPNIPTSSQQTHPPLRNPTLQQIGMLKPTAARNEYNTTERPTTLTSSLAPLTSKPPQSPTQTSPRLPRHDIQKSSSLVLERAPSLKSKLDKKPLGSIEKLNQNESYNRNRFNTISVMSPARKPRSETNRRANSPRPKEMPKSGINPSFVFLQLYYTSHFGNVNEKPLLVPSTQGIQRSLKVLDCIPPYETHKVGVIYVGPDQNNNETEILKNRFGSTRYVDFLQKLGTLIKLQDVDSQVFFLGGLEQNGTDGKFAYIWQDDVMQVVFHVATLMPCKENDQLCNNKKLHIGNNFVTIVYNESGEDYNIQTLKGQFNYASIIIQPLDHSTNRVTIKAKDELAEHIGHSEPKIISDQNVAILARQLALHANLASMVARSLNGSSQDPYASNWLERLRKIKQLRSKILQEHSTSNEPYEGQMEDFTEYT